MDLLRSILGNKALNETQNVAYATMAAIMGRMSAYSGQLVRWSDVMENDKSKFFNEICTPTAADFEAGTVKCPQEETAPVPGNDYARPPLTRCAKGRPPGRPFFCSPLSKTGRPGCTQRP